MFRWLTLTLGPVAIVGGLYWLLRPEFGADLIAAQARQERNDTGSQTPRRADARVVEDGCMLKGTELRRKLGNDCRVIVHAPFVIAGDLSDAELERHYQATVVPTARALFVSFFDVLPDEPVTIVLLSTEAGYRRCAQDIDGSPRAGYSGYYERGDRRVMVNVATGNGTLAHELTHALAHFDFPDMPEWFDEGLASLHEQSEFSEDGLRIVGTSNWRLHYLLPAIRKETLQPLESLVASRRVSSDQESVDYAQARYLCLYLQQKNLLGPFYRKFRETALEDPTGARALCQLLSVDSLAAVDRDFRKWALSFHRGAP